MEGLGYCAATPAGGTFGVLQYLQRSKLPPPLAFFPLTAPLTGEGNASTGGCCASLLLPAYNVSAAGAPLPSWVHDTTFASVVNCSQVGTWGAALVFECSQCSFFTRSSLAP